MKQQGGHSKLTPLQSAFENWEPTEVSNAVWERLEESIAIESVWNKLDQELTAVEASKDHWLKSAHANWNPAAPSDGWEKLSDDLSREVVWDQLAVSLAHPVATRIPLLKMIAATIALVFSTFYLADVAFDLHPIYASERAKTRLNQENQQTASEVVEHTDATTVSNTTGYKASDFDKLDDNSQIVQNDNLVHAPTNQSVDVEPLSNLVAIEPSFIVPELNRLGNVPSTHFLHPTWTVQLGSQWSFIGENNRSAFSSAMPKLGLAMDVSYSRSLGNWRFTQSAGFSQYAQNNGRYVNGRYLNTNQRLNTFQLSSSVGYELNRFHVFGGIMVARLLGGLEENKSQVTNVYTVSELRMGITGGLDYRIKDFKNGMMLSAGAQYQWIPKLESSNVVFENIQGLKLQTKISF